MSSEGLRVAQLITELSKLSDDTMVCLDCRRCGAVVVGDVEITGVNGNHEPIEGTVWLAEES